MTNGKKKVLIVVSNLKVAGAQKMVEQLVLSINKQLFEVFLICISSPQNSVIEKKIESNNIPILYLNKRLGFHPSIIFKVWKIVSKIEPSVIHTHVSSWIYVFFIAWIKNIKILHTIHSRPNRQEVNQLQRKLVKFLYHHNVMIPVAISSEIKKESLNIYDMAEEKVEMVVNPVDYDNFSKVVPQPHDNIVYVNVARFNVVKNQSLLVKAFATAYQENRNIRLIFAGEGETFEEIKQLVNQLEMEDIITFKGNVEDVAKLFEVCDVFVLPSLSEGLPISILEAEAASLPIIASRIGGIPDIFEDNGLLFEVNDEKGLVNSILELSHQEIRQKYAEKSRRIAEKYSADKVAKRYEELYVKYGS